MAPTPISERESRYASIRAEMVEQGIDALIIGCKGHMWTGRGYARYLSDFHLWGHDGLILLPADGEPAMAITSPAVAGMISRHGWIPDTRGDVYLLSAFVDALRERALERGRLGTVGARWIIPSGLHDELIAELPAAQVAPADELVDLIRMAKSPLEVAQNRDLWALSKGAIERFVEVLEPGASQRALSAEACRYALERGARDILVLIGDRPDVYGPPMDAAIRCDDLVRFHLEICGESGHWCELTVTLAFRPIKEAERRLMASELRALEAVRAAARPGVRLGDLAGRFEQVMVEDGWQLGPPTRHFDFHGQGMDVIERPWYAAEQPWGGTNDAVVTPGTIMSYHPRRNVVPEVAWGPGVSDNLLVTDGEAEWLSGNWSHDWREVST
jgi:Xaa-Pro aminopeptidase